jgi:hypothetical protein
MVSDQFIVTSVTCRKIIIEKIANVKQKNHYSVFADRIRIAFPVCGEATIPSAGTPEHISICAEMKRKDRDSISPLL